MIQEIFTIYDSKAGAYLPPFFLPTVPMATRVFGDCVNDPTHQFSKHPLDYTLVHVGQFNDQNADIEIIKHKIIGTGADFKIEEMPDTREKSALTKSVDEVLDKQKTKLKKVMTP